MPYPANEDLPAAVRGHLPQHAQDIFRAAFNNAWARYGAGDPRGREESARRIAWAAVKRRYEKAGRDWLPIAGA
ncbi:MAG: ChaB family protein [Hyphomicrobiales bacterium]